MSEDQKSVGGRPLKFTDVEELDLKIEEYFNKTEKDEWTWTGLALYLDTDKWTLKDYRDEEGNRKGFSPSLKRALSRIENGYEVDLKKHGRTGTIFALKNFDWKDKTEQDINATVKTDNLPDTPELADAKKASAEAFEKVYLERLNKKSDVPT